MGSDCFELTFSSSDCGARNGVLNLQHGKVNTPIFLPVGSQATVRTLTPEELLEIGIDMILCNTYHIYLRPGIDTLNKCGGLHKFMRWEKPILTDSGGYQVFSLSSLRNIEEEGVIFNSHIDGSRHRLTPELVIELQEQMGSDIIMPLDVCQSNSANKKKMTEAVDMTSRWALRCKKRHNDNGQYLFGIIQGGVYPDLRKQSAEQLVELDLPGYAIGGLSIGETKSAMWETVSDTLQYMPIDKPRYLMGVGTPEDILAGIELGIDVFDSALPTRVARNGALYTYSGRVNIKRAVFKNVLEPVSPICGCYTCKNYSAAYLHHLFKCEELLAYRLATIHNLHFMQTFINEIRYSIRNCRFSEFKKTFLANYKTTDEEARVEQKNKNLARKRFDVA